MSLSLDAGGAEAFGASGGIIEFLGIIEELDGSVGDGCDDHLCDPVAVVDGEWLLSEVDECDEDFASVVGVDGARGVWERDAVLCREP